MAKRPHPLDIGLASDLRDGLVWAVPEVEEQVPPGIVLPARIALYSEVEHVLKLHRSDAAVPPNAKPDGAVYPNAAYLLAVEDGRIIGYMSAYDDAEDGADWYPRTLAPDLLVNTWLAKEHRGRGVGKAMLTETLRRFPTAHKVQGPLSPAGERLLASVAPDILAAHLAVLAA